MKVIYLVMHPVKPASGVGGEQLKNHDNTFAGVMNL